MQRVPVKQCTLVVGQQPKFYAEVGDTVMVRGHGGVGLIAATLESINGDKVTVRNLHDEETQELATTELVAVCRT